MELIMASYNSYVSICFCEKRQTDRTISIHIYATCKFCLILNIYLKICKCMSRTSLKNSDPKLSFLSWKDVIEMEINIGKSLGNLYCSLVKEDRNN